MDSVGLDPRQMNAHSPERRQTGPFLSRAADDAMSQAKEGTEADRVEATSVGRWQLGTASLVDR